MKSLHRGKAIESFTGAKVVMSKGLIYPAYILLKESLRATLAYIQEDLTNKEYSEKTKLRSLIATTPEVLTPETNLATFDIILEMEEQGLDAIMSTDIK